MTKTMTSFGNALIYR